MSQDAIQWAPDATTGVGRVIAPCCRKPVRLAYRCGCGNSHEPDPGDEASALIEVDALRAEVERLRALVDVLTLVNAEVERERAASSQAAALWKALAGKLRLNQRETRESRARHIDFTRKLLTERKELHTLLGAAIDGASNEWRELAGAAMRKKISWP